MARDDEAKVPAEARFPLRVTIERSRRVMLEAFGRLVMKTVFAVLPCIVALAPNPTPALADDKPSLEVLYEVVLDIDNDGKSDRAALVQEPGSKGGGDLYIYLGAGGEKLDLSKKPTFRKDFAEVRFLGLESNSKGSLVVTDGCGGCSNDFETILTIVHRGGEFLVAGFTYQWETRDRRGSCDINFLSGRGVASDGVGGEKPIKGKFRPIKLADWSDDKRPKPCDVEGDFPW
jgi:hypothetical protein